MTDILMFDASIPPGKPYPGATAVAGYIGGDTPHVWSPDEWKVFDGMRKLPIFVRSNPGSVKEGEVDGKAAVDALRALKVPFQQDPPDHLRRLLLRPWRLLRRLWRRPGNAVSLDLETAVDREYVIAFNEVVKAAGYVVWVYGSGAFVVQNPPCAGRWCAGYRIPPVPYHYPAKYERGTQYVAGVPWDNTTVDLSVVRRFFARRRLHRW